MRAESKLQSISKLFIPESLYHKSLLFRETFIKRYVAEKTSKAEIRSEEQSEKAENSWENL